MTIEFDCDECGNTRKVVNYISGNVGGCPYCVPKILKLEEKYASFFDITNGQKQQLVAFISGHLDLDKEEFEQHYVPALESALLRGCKFVVGDARGADTLAQEWLKNRNVQVIVYHMYEKPRNNFGFTCIGGFLSDDERDSVMTKESDFDIAWVRPGRENSGTAKNIARRTNGNKIN